MKRLEIRSRAVHDIDAATDYYALVTEALANRWLDALERAFRHVRQHPRHGSPVFAEQLGIPGLRHHRVGRFPYLVFYVETETTVVVVRVLHERRDVAGEALTTE